MSQGNWTAERTAKLRQMWLAGKTQREIGLELGIDRGAVSSKINRERLPRRMDGGYHTPKPRKKPEPVEAPVKIKRTAHMHRPEPLTPAQRAAIRRMWVDDHGDRYIAKALGIGRWRVATEIENLRAEIRDAAPDDWMFVEQLMELGGLPRAAIVAGCTVWLGPDNCPWFDRTTRAA
jgi:DNA-binding transcriptional regulator LsrR (DeoR family)